MVWLVGLGRLVGLGSERIPENERDWHSWGVPYPWNPKAPTDPNQQAKTISDQVVGSKLSRFAGWWFQQIFFGIFTPDPCGNDPI